ncbi:MAG: tetratricopeptide repeat protein [Burkholderiaceae bacterium]|nr:tetratricopeptide repeat protein [Burkholderiaceae bacterium]
MNIASRFISPVLQRYRRAANRFCATAFCLALVLFSPLVAADELANTRQLLNDGRLSEALATADSYLSTRPNDAHMLFLKGLILTEQNQSAKAIDVFTQITAQYPALPEPYNNLAVLYASSGQLDKARVALEASIRTNPAYATAHENLGDLYARMASQAYDKALQINSNNAAAKTKLAMLNSLTGDTATATAAQPSSRASASATPSVAASASVSATTPPAASASATAPVSKPASASAPAPKPEPKPAASSEPKPAGQPGQDDVVKTLNDWAAAWSARDVKKYLGFYANDFHLPKGKSRKAWADERNSRIASKRQINVKIESPQVTLSGNTATVKFRQSYKADKLSVSSKKTMVLVKSGGKWKIQQELAGN